MFAYCGNNPVHFSDETGNWPEWVTKLVVAAAAAIVSVVTVAIAASSTTRPPVEPHVPSQQEKSFAATVYAEAGGQNLRTKQAVANVMNNRIGTRSSWSNIEAVLSAPGQFNGYGNRMYQEAMEYYNTGICNNAIIRKALDECMSVVIPIYNGTESDITGGALYFHSLKKPSDWKYHKYYTLVDIPGTECFWFYK